MQKTIIFFTVILLCSINTNNSLPWDDFFENQIKTLEHFRDSMKQSLQSLPLFNDPKPTITFDIEDNNKENPVKYIIKGIKTDTFDAQYNDASDTLIINMPSQRIILTIDDQFSSVTVEQEMIEEKSKDNNATHNYYHASSITSGRTLSSPVQLKDHVIDYLADANTLIITLPRQVKKGVSKSVPVNIIKKADLQTPQKLS
jgi:hypothetical protein